MAGCRVLLLYPNERDVSLVPPVFGLFAALLRERGHKTTLFDCTGYDMEGKADPDIEREKTLFMKPTGPSTDKQVKKKLTNMYDDFTEKVQTFSPDLIAMSVTEHACRGTRQTYDAHVCLNLPVYISYPCSLQSLGESKRICKEGFAAR